MTPSDLAAAGQALAGPDHWQAYLAQLLVGKPASQTPRVRQWLSGKRPIPDRVRVTLVGELRRASAECATVADRLELGGSMSEFTPSKNPSATDIRAIIAACPGKCARRVIDVRNGDAWVWPHHQATHAEGARLLDIPYSIRPGHGDVLIDDG